MQAQTDWGSSHNLLVKAKLDENWFIISRSNMATRDEFRDQHFWYAGAGLGYQLTKEWSLRAGYRHAQFRPVDKWLKENRTYLEGYYANRFEGFRFTSRSRFEFRDYADARTDDVRFRNEFVLEAPWKWTPLALQPYLEEEVFYSFENERIDMNWLGCGLSWRPMDGVKLKLGYRWNYYRVGNDFRNRNTVVTGMNLFF
ncbi:MAG: DUF2490 domain-containing protein [Verrucomicrobiota bacterium]